MGFLVTLIYVSVCFLTPTAFGITGDALHLPFYLAIVAMCVGVFYVNNSPALRLPQLYLVFGWTAIACLSMVQIYITGAVEAFRLLLPMLVASILITLTCTRVSYLVAATYTMWAICAFIIVMGFLEERDGTTGLYVMREMVQSTTGSAMTLSPTFRIMGLGFINDPNDFGQLMVSLLPLLWLRWKPNAAIRNFLLTILPAAMLVWGIYLTRSRGTTVALIVVLFFAFKDRLGVVLSSVIGAVSLVALLALGLTGGRGIAEDDGSRVGLWSQCFVAFRQHPIFGVGLGQVLELTDTHQTAHNSFVLSFTETGIIGYFFFVAILLSCWMSLTKMMQGRETAKQEAEELAQGDAAPWTRKPIGTSPLTLPTFAAAGAPGSPLLATTVPTPGGGRRILTYAERQAAMTGTPEAAAPSGPLHMQTAVQPPAPKDLEHAAFCMRLSMVGLLASCMFLSRTYSMLLYVIVGMIGALVAMDPREIAPTIPELFKKTPAWAIGSIVVIYLIIRSHVGH